MIEYMARYKEDGTVQLCKAKHSALDALKARDYKVISKDEWERLHKEWRKEKLGETEKAE